MVVSVEWEVVVSEVGLCSLGVNLSLQVVAFLFLCLFFFLFVFFILACFFRWPSTNLKIENSSLSCMSLKSLASFVGRFKSMMELGQLGMN